MPNGSVPEADRAAGNAPLFTVVWPEFCRETAEKRILSAEIASQ
jgi:hypothetical protein